MSDPRFKHVQYLWKDEEAAKLSPSERLVYRSNRLGDDLSLTNTGGGNTSAKVIEKDPLTGKDVEVLWIKGSGGDLRTAKKDGFASLYLDKVRALTPLYQNNPGKGPKTPVEDAMVEMFSHCVFNLNPRACSIDTPLHTLVPKKHVDHLHPNAVIALAASVNQERLTKEIYGKDVFWVPWQRPGFDMSSIIEDHMRRNPAARVAKKCRIPESRSLSPGVSMRATNTTPANPMTVFGSQAATGIGRIWLRAILVIQIHAM